MIRGRDVFGRDAISPHEKKTLKAANRAARNLFKIKNTPALRESWGVRTEDVTLELAEAVVVEAVKKYRQ